MTSVSNNAATPVAAMSSDFSHFEMLRAREQQLRELDAALNARNSQVTQQINATINATKPPTATTSLSLPTSRPPSARTSRQDVNRSSSVTPPVTKPSTSRTRRATVIVNTAHNDDATTVSAAATIRVQKSRITTLTATAAALAETIKANEAAMAAAAADTKKLSDENAKLVKANNALSAAVTAAKAESNTFKSQAAVAAAEIGALTKDKESLLKVRSAIEVELRDVSSKYERALIDNNKTIKKNANADSGDLSARIMSLDQTVTELKNTNQLLLSQRNELISAVKKQSKLIDVLRKQKVHLECARMLQFNEEQFANALKQ